MTVCMVYRKVLMVAVCFYCIHSWQFDIRYLLFTMKNRFETKSKDSISHWKSFDRFKKLTKKVWLIDRHWTVKLISHSYFVWDCEFVCMCVCLSVCVCVKMRKLIRKTKKRPTNVFIWKSKVKKPTKNHHQIFISFEAMWACVITVDTHKCSFYTPYVSTD